MIDTIQFEKQTQNNGYIRIKVENKWNYEHIWIIEQFIGRELEEGECVHHLDGNKKNNILDNLMLFKSQNEHKSFENKVKQFGWTKPMLERVKNRWKEYERNNK